MFDGGRKLRYFSPAAMRLVIVVHKRPHNCAAVLDRDIIADEPSDAAILTDDDIIAQVRSVNNARPCAYWRFRTPNHGFPTAANEEMAISESVAWLTAGVE